MSGLPTDLASALTLLDEVSFLVEGRADEIGHRTLHPGHAIAEKHEGLLTEVPAVAFSLEAPADIGKLDGRPAGGVCLQLRDISVEPHEHVLQQQHARVKLFNVGHEFLPKPIARIKAVFRGWRK